MSCHSTPANVAVLGFHAQCLKLPMRAVETEFHWLKKIGRDRAVSAPSREEWGDFLLQRERWVKHEENLSPKRRETALGRLAESYDQVPDGPTFYALSNLPVRLQQVTSTSSVEAALDRVVGRAERMEEGAQGKDSNEAVRVIADAVWDVSGDLGGVVDRGPHPSSRESLSRAVEAIRRVDLEGAAPAQIYLAHEKLMQSLRATRRTKSV